MLPYLTALFVLFWQWNNQRRWRPVFWGQRLKNKKVVNFSEEKVHPVTWLEDFLTSKWHGSFTALHLMTCLTTLVTWKWPGCLDVLAPPQIRSFIIMAASDIYVDILISETAVGLQISRRHVVKNWSAAALLSQQPALLGDVSCCWRHNDARLSASLHNVAIHWHKSLAMDKVKINSDRINASVLIQTHAIVMLCMCNAIVLQWSAFCVIASTANYVESNHSWLPLICIQFCSLIFRLCC